MTYKIGHSNDQHKIGNSHLNFNPFKTLKLIVELELVVLLYCILQLIKLKPDKLAMLHEVHEQHNTTLSNPVFINLK